MKKAYTLLFALLMMTVSLAGCLESDDDITENQFEMIFDSSDHQNILGAQFFELNGITYFAISNSLNLENIGIYQTDGTADGTELIWEPTGTAMGDVFVLQSSLVFQVGMELWASDGTSLGTEMIADFSTSAEFLRIVSWDTDNVGLFVTHVHHSSSPNAQQGSASLWISDSTTAGTNEVFQYQSIDSSFYSDSSNGILYFGANDSQSGNELWMSDGTTQGTEIFYEAVSGYDGVFFEFVYATSQNVFWSSTTGSYSNLENRAFNLATGTTELIHSNPNIATIHQHFILENNLYFVDLNQDDESQLYFSDGTASGTVMIHQFTSLVLDVQHTFTMGSNIFFNIREQGSLGSIWVLDSSNQFSSFGSYHSGEGAASQNPLIYFSSSVDGIDGCSTTSSGSTGCDKDIFTTDGTLSGTNLLLNTNGDTRHISIHSGILYFTQDHSIHAYTL